MRLLHLKDDSLTLTNFTGKPIPPYAILSHRWTDDEVLYKDVSGGKVDITDKKGLGWKKIKFCAEKTSEHKLKYFWIDTCCIDKWNRTELDRSLNSMFKWYRNSVRCFVYLQDVNETSEICGSQVVGSWETQLKGSVWFKRGWTLQELIAPSTVDFYDAQEAWIGDKKSLEPLICEVTKLPRKAVQGHIDDFNSTERLQWSANRYTTEPEDNAYCLLGILGVEMSLTYGEGKEKAMLRLQQEVEAADRAPCILPFSRNDSFTSQNDALADIKQRLWNNKDESSVLVITGDSGSGKSSLALEFCHQTRIERPECLVFWVDASSLDTLQQSYSDIARKLRILQDLQQLKEIIAGVYQYLQSQATGEWLLVYDNVEEASVVSVILPNARKQKHAVGFPTTDRGSIIITTTNAELARNLPASSIDMPKLTEASAASVLEAYLHGMAPEDRDQPEIWQLGTLLDRPLGVAIATAYLQASKVHIKEYVDRFQEEVAARTKQNNSTNQSIDIVIDLSIRHIIERHPEVADFLFTLAFYARQDIPTALFGEYNSVLISKIDLLSQYGLITRRPATSAIDIHRLVFEAIVSHSENSGRFEHYRKQAVEQMTAAFPDPDAYNRFHWRRYLPHARQAIGKGDDKDDPSCLALISKCGEALCLDRRWKEAGELQKRVLKIRKKDLGQDHPDTLDSMTNLSSTYSNQERWEEAAELDREVIERRKAVLGENHPDTLASISELAATYRDQGRWLDAEELNIQVMETRKAVLGPDHPDTLDSMSDLAMNFWDQNRWAEAEELDVQVLKRRKDTLGQDHPDTLTSMGNLATTYRDRGRLDEAEELDAQVMEINLTVLGQDHPDTLDSMSNLALTYRHQRQWKKAEELELQVVEIRKTVFGPDHPTTLTSMINLADTYMSQGRSREENELRSQVKKLRSASEPAFRNIGYQR